MTERPMDGTGTLLRRGPDGQPLEDYFGGANVPGGYWVELVDAWPHGRLQAQLDRIEQKMDGFAAYHGTIVPPDDRIKGWNRWAAFTDDELAQLADLDESGNYPTRSYFDDPLWQEIKAEIERRKQA